MSYSGSKRMKAMDREEDEMSEEEGEEVRKYPRKQIHHSYQTSTGLEDSMKKKRDSRMSTPRNVKKEEESEYHEKSDKKGSHGNYRTPNVFSENLKKNPYTEYTPSPGKAALYEGRTRRSVRPFNHHSGDYEVEK